MVVREIMKFLVVDADKANVKYLQGALQPLGCEVKACKYKEQALSLLREQKKRFDIVLVDVDIPYEMGFKFVEIVSSKMNIPIIMMCSASDNEIIAAGINSGACQVAVKPINDVRRLFQCAVEHRTQHLLGVSNSARNSKRLHGQENGSNLGTIGGTLYKDRLVWTEDLKALFVEAVDALGGKDVAAPMKIMEWMNVPDLTRENISSHLQKYRLYSDLNYVGGKRKRKAAQAMQVNGIDEKAPVVAHPNRPLEALEMGNGGNDPATDSLIKDNVEATNPVVMHNPQNISSMGGIVDHLNSPGQQQEQIGGTPQEQPRSWSGLGTSEPSTLGQGTRNGYVWFGPKPPGAT